MLVVVVVVMEMKVVLVVEVVVVVVAAVMMETMVVVVVAVAIVEISVGLCLRCVVFYVFSVSPWIVRLVFEAFSFLVLCCIKESLCLCHKSHIGLWCFCHKCKLSRSRCVVSFLVVVTFDPWFSYGALHSRHFLPCPIASIWFPLLLCGSASLTELLGWYSGYVGFWLILDSLGPVLGVGPCFPNPSRRRGRRSGTWRTVWNLNKRAQGVWRCKGMRTG
jgi:hypothetical protein